MAKGKDPIWEIMKHQQRTLAWLARRTKYSLQYVTSVKAGIFPLTAEFRERCTFALDLPDSVLFFQQTESAEGSMVAPTEAAS